MLTLARKSPTRNILGKLFVLFAYGMAALCTWVVVMLFMKWPYGWATWIPVVCLGGAAVFFACVPKLTVGIRRYIKRQKIEPSIRLRLLAFVAQVVGVLSLGYGTGLWGIAAFSAIVLALGHLYSYRYRAKPKRWVRIVIFVLFHLTFGWAYLGIVNAWPQPQAQLAMLAMAVVSWELFKRLNLYSAMGMGLINLYAACTLSRDLVFGGFRGRQAQQSHRRKTQICLSGRLTHHARQSMVACIPFYVLRLTFHARPRPRWCHHLCVLPSLRWRAHRAAADDPRAAAGPAALRDHQPGGAGGADRGLVERIERLLLRL